MGALSDAYTQRCAVRAAATGPGEGNKQPNIGQSRTGHFNDSVNTSLAANDAPPVGPPATIAQASDAAYAAGMHITHSHADRRY
jgi:hypothetical protein